MSEKLTMRERKVVGEFINSADNIRPSPVNPLIVSGFVSICGCVLFAAASLITLNRFSDRSIYWVFLPGLLGGTVMIMSGIFLYRSTKIKEEKRILAGILRKLLD
jgi:hypothetical protein